MHAFIFFIFLYLEVQKLSPELREERTRAHSSAFAAEGTRGKDFGTLSQEAAGTQENVSPEGEVALMFLRAYYRMSDNELVEMLNGTSMRIRTDSDIRFEGMRVGATGIFGRRTGGRYAVAPEGRGVVTGAEGIAYKNPAGRSTDA